MIGAAWSEAIRGVFSTWLRRGSRRDARKQIQVGVLTDHDLGHLKFREDWAEPTDEDLAAQAAGSISTHVAWLGRHAVGIGYVHWGTPRHEELVERWSGVPEIYRLYVEPRARSYGVGSRLIAEMERTAASRGFARVAVGVHVDNDLAHQLYLRLGYKDAGVRFHDRFRSRDASGKWRDVDAAADWMVKKLAGQPAAPAPRSVDGP